LPCIATDISGNQDLIENKSNGILVPPFNIENLAEAIVYLLDNSEEAKKMGLLARQTVIDRCSFDIVSAQYENLYHELLSDTG
jgi:glycosyltransferase involved in cell wall biosynthesis